MKKFMTIVTLAAAFAVCGTVSAAATAQIVNKPTYSDVNSGYGYFDAIELLKRLDIMEGYENGSFQPDRKVTRAEFSKLIVNALGQSARDEVKDASESAAAFSDVGADHWASGYITAATSYGLINGMGDGTFAPEANITYSQAVKMLVCAAGYETWSVDRGGWPRGYMYWGDNIKLGAGVHDVSEAVEITRGQTAQMIKNVLIAPIVVETHDYTYDMFGNRYPTLTMKDGVGDEFEPLMIKGHGVYPVKGYMSSEKEFVITYAKNFGYEYYGDGSKEKIAVRTDYGKDCLNKEASAYIKDGGDDKYTLVYMTSANTAETEISKTGQGTLSRPGDYDEYGNKIRK